MVIELKSSPEGDERGIVRIGSVGVPFRRTAWGVVAYITPLTAKALLGQNGANRNVRRTRCALYARDMQADRWYLNGEPLIFASDGTLLNGQHRLHACVEADTPFEAYIIGDVEIETRDSMDSGLVRTLGDVLGFEGETNGRSLAAALHVAWRIDTTGTLFFGAGYPAATRSDLLAYLHDHPSIRESLVVGRRLAKSPVRFSESLAAGLHFLTARSDVEDAADFWDRLEDGVGLYPGHPVLALRNILLGQIGAPRRLTSTDIGALTLKAWAAFRERKPLKQLRWRRRGDKPEPFPKVV